MINTSWVSCYAAVLRSAPSARADRLLHVWFVYFARDSLTAYVAKVCLCSSYVCMISSL